MIRPQGLDDPTKTKTSPSNGIMGEGWGSKFHPSGAFHSGPRSRSVQSREIIYCREREGFHPFVPSSPRDPAGPFDRPTYPLELPFNLLGFIIAWSSGNSLTAATPISTFGSLPWSFSFSAFLSLSIQNIYFFSAFQTLPDFFTFFFSNGQRRSCFFIF